MPKPLAVRIIGFSGLGDFIPFYAMYALLFADAGLSLGEISSLFAIWSVTALVLEVPSGAWADVVSRRLLLTIGPMLHAAGFASWILVPDYAGFALGFMLWGAGSALVSGTLEAFVYDELAAIDATPSYAGLMGFAGSASSLAILAATFLAAPLFALGGYPLVAWSSVAVTLGQALIAASLPAAPKVAEADEIDTGDAPAAGSIATRYLRMLKAGLTEVSREHAVRNAVLITAFIYGLNTHDEYFALVAAEKGTATTFIAVLVGITAVGEAVGTALAGRTVAMRNSTMAALLVLAAALFAGGSVSGGLVGFVGLAVASGIHNNVIVVNEARLQDTIEGPARATVTSVNGLLTELVAIGTFVAYAAGSNWLSVSSLVAVMGIPLVMAALLVPRWTPPRSAGDVA
ncbi:MAG: MFS transporter [Geodermatophilaceae bacterium]